MQDRNRMGAPLAQNLFVNVMSCMDFDIVDKLGAADRCPMEEFWDSLTWFTMPMV